MSKKERNKSKKATTSTKSRSLGSTRPEKNRALVDRPVDSGEDAHLSKFFWGSVFAILILTVAMAFGSGLNGDEYWQDIYAERYMKWYETMGQDTSCFYFEKGPVQHYGAFFELIAGYSNKALGYDTLDPAYYTVRHFWIALFGVLAICMVGLFTREIGGWRAGLLALWILFLSPRFLGHSLMNPKDIPFAAGYAMTLFFLARTLKTLPRPDWKILLGLAAGIGIGVGVRPGGLLFAAITGMFIGLEYLGSYGIGALFSQPKLLGKYVLYALIAAIGGTFLGFLFWPYALVDPFTHVPESFKAVSQFAVNIRMLFNGSFVFSQEIPAYYTSLWMLYTLPLFALLGLGLFAGFLKGVFRKYPPLLLALSLFAFLFPLVFVIYTKSPMYDGWRHMIFPYMGAVPLMALGWEYCYQKFEQQKVILYVLAGILGLTAGEAIYFIVRNHNMPYVYFNPLAGGVKGAYGNFETDYWGVAAKEAVDWLEGEGILNPDMPGQVVLASDFNYAAERYLKKKYGDKLSIRYIKYRQRYDKEWDYAIFGTRFLDPEHLKNGTWPTLRTIHKVKVGGVAVMAVMEDKDKFMFKGMQAYKSGSNEEAIGYFVQELQKDSLNELAVMNVVNASLNIRNLPQAKAYIEKYDRIIPNNYMTQNLWGSYYLQMNDANAAINAFKQAIELQADNGTAYYYLGYIYMTQNRLNEAAEMAKKAVEVAPSFRQAYELAAQIYDQLGDTGMANAYRQAIQKLR